VVCSQRKVGEECCEIKEEDGRRKLRRKACGRHYGVLRTGGPVPCLDPLFKLEAWRLERGLQ